MFRITSVTYHGNILKTFQKTLESFHKCPETFHKTAIQPYTTLLKYFWQEMLLCGNNRLLGLWGGEGFRKDGVTNSLMYVAFCGVKLVRYGLLFISWFEIALKNIAEAKNVPSKLG